jgi:hypothetical protein
MDMESGSGKAARREKLPAITGNCYLHGVQYHDS